MPRAKSRVEIRLATVLVTCADCGEPNTVAIGSIGGRAETPFLCAGCASWHRLTVAAEVRPIPRPKESA